MKLRRFVEGEAFLDELWLSDSQEEFCSVELVISLVDLPWLAVSWGLS